MRSILSIIGARPQFIKHAPLQQRLSEHFRALTLHTGQHYDANMSGIFFEELGMPKPDYQLEMSGARSGSEQTGMMMTEIERICSSLQPDAVLVYGDTNSTLAGSLVAVKMGIPIIHVEAGIRSFNRAMPEEVNRIVADTFARLLLCPIPQAVENLQKEGIDHKGVYLSGDLMCDLLESVRGKIHSSEQGEYYFTTIHRPYNTDKPERMRAILGTLNSLDHPVIFPIHPRTLSRLKAASIELAEYPNIRAIAPVGYIECLSMQAGATCVITDSGGIQKEAYMLQKKCITLRSETEWNETLIHGWNTLVFEDVAQIKDLVHQAPGTYEAGMFGDGRAADKIMQAIMEFFAVI
jgi:UDP-GlcNAc3NAcA epimerase